MSKNKCKLCSRQLAESDLYVSQGYCTECGSRFTRHGGGAEKQTSKNSYLRAAMTKPEPQAAQPPPHKPTTAPEKRQNRTKKTRKCGGSRCNRCGDFGHMAVECRTKICSFCHTRGHDRDQCFSDPVNCCEKCGTYGHTITKCKLCERCGDFGHGAEECRTKICEDCGRRGHKKETCWSRKVCKRCGITGHIAQACRTRLWCAICQEAHRKCDKEEETTETQDKAEN